MKTMIGCVLALSGLVGCLESREETPSCGAGDAQRYDGGWYCIYSGAIIIEGFLCPEAMPHQFMFEGEAMGFGAGAGQVGVCSPTETPPAGGWRELFEAWKNSGGQVGPRPDVTDTQGDSMSDTEETVDTEPSDTGPGLETVEVDGDGWGSPCDEGIGQSRCWVDEQCPVGWRCAEATVGCTSCDVCEGATLGDCYTSFDELGLLWRGGERVVLWSVAQVYTLIPCPALTVETATSIDGPWTSVGSESGCTGTVEPPYYSAIVRTLPALDPALWVRVRGALKTGCSTDDPAECQGELELTSPPLAPAP